MNVSDAAIRQLHQLLIQIADIKSQIERGPRQIRAAQVQVDTVKTALQNCKDSIKQKRMEVDRKQLNLREREAKIHDWEGKMNAAKNNREFQAIKEQIAADSQANSVLSDEMFETLEEIDALQIEQKEFEAKLAATEAEKTRIEGTINDRIAVLKNELIRVEGNLQTAEEALPGEVLADYKRLISIRGEDCLAPLDDVSCGGCNTGLPPRIIDKLRLGQPIACPSCARLLYRPEQ